MSSEKVEDSALQLQIRLFGAFDVQVNGAPIPPLRSRKVQWLLALFVLRHGQALDRAWLAGTLWPESTHSQALYNLRQSLSNLRQAFGPMGSCFHASMVNALSLDLTHATVDVLTFDAAILTGGREALERAAAVYRGPLLEGCAEEWVLLERQSREENYLNALENLASMALSRQEGNAAVTYLRTAIIVDPLREQAQRALIQALAAMGDYGAAVQTYRDLRLMLRRELNTDPDPQTTTLFQQIRGEARLRAQVNPTVPLLPRPGPPRQLPSPLTALIGRRSEVEQIAATLRTARLLTLTGPGGVGKTHLALAVAGEVAKEYPDGAFFADLAPLNDAALIPQTVASVLNVREEPGRSLLSTLQDHVRSRALLLLLDNCEHLLNGCAHLANGLLRECPGVCILATSRQPVGITGEVAWAVPSLSTPALSDLAHRDKYSHRGWLSLLSEYEAVELFVTRAQQVLPSFQMSVWNAEAVVQICTRLDGIPLALELAAARMRSLTAEEINNKLDSRFHLLTGGSRTALPRQRTLRALMDWSYDLLDDRERALLCRLAAFAGGWTLDAAEQVCTGQCPGTEEVLEAWDVLDLLTSLVDKSLVVAERGAGRTRYRLLETMRQYALDRLVESGDCERVRRKHQAFYLGFSEEAEPQLWGPLQAVWLERIEREHDNLRRALEEGSEEAALRIIGVLWPFWYVRGYFSEGRIRLAGILEGAAGQDCTPARAKALNGAGALAWSQGDYAAARILQDESLALCRAVGDKRGIADALRSLGMIAYVQGDYTYAHTLYTESLPLYREEEDIRGVAAALGNLGNTAYVQGDYAEAQALYEESLALQRELGNKRGIAASLNNLGLVACDTGDYAFARTLYAESLPLYQEIGDRVGIAYSLDNLGSVISEQGDYASARALIEESLALRRELGDKRGIAASLSSLGRVAYEHGEYAVARTLLGESLPLYRELENKQGIAYSLEATAALASGQNRATRAARLWGAAEALRQAVHNPLSPAELPPYTRLVTKSRAELSEEAFATAWSDGRAMPLAQAMEYALE